MSEERAEYKVTQPAKPQMKREVAIDKVMPSLYVIYFYGTPDSAKEFEAFGQVDKGHPIPNWYRLTVDRRFSFAEVLKYIEEYGK